MEAGAGRGGHGVVQVAWWWGGGSRLAAKVSWGESTEKEAHTLSRTDFAARL